MAAGDAHGNGGTGAGASVRRRRLTAVAWVCSVVAAAVLGAWSFAHADPAGRYARSEPLTDAGVRQELAKEQAAHRSPSPPGTPDANSAQKSAGSERKGEPDAESAATTLRLPGGVATAVCRADGRVRLVSWSPAQGYGVDDLERGPAAVASLEFEPTDDGDVDDEDGDDIHVTVRCHDGTPRSDVTEGDEDDD